jgi:DNA-binding PucR family transcriptional regulator
MGVVSLRPGQFDLLRGVLDEMATTRVGISPTFRLLRDTPRALHLARVALSSVEAGRGTVAQFSTAPLAALVASDVQEARRIAEEVLGAVLKLPAQERTMLLDTLQAWFDQAGSAERAADQLHCHPNTVRYRLRRLHELIDRSLTEPYAIADVAAALRALQLAGLP